MRLMAGLLAGQTFESRLSETLSFQTADGSRHRSNCNGWEQTLPRKAEGTAPLRIHGGSLRGIRYQMPVASAQIKSAILLAGLFCKEEKPPSSRRPKLAITPSECCVIIRAPPPR